jgi:Bacterial antitoxin of type II TA system, VapB
MKITVELDDTTLAELLAATNERKKGPAVTKAVAEYLKRGKAREFGRLLMEGAFDYPTSDEKTARQGF